MKKNFALNTPMHNTGVGVGSSTDKHSVGFGGLLKATGNLTQHVNRLK